ncbi:MAG: AI-2E family transporter, partial [Anaerolineae bacterium]|nr:AI-2E family transporter [Anaerolineae bacterium]
MDMLKAWFKRTFSDPQVVILGLFLLVGALVVFGLGKMLAPVFTAIVLAYLLQALVDQLVRFGMHRLLAVILVFMLFLAVLFFLLFGLIPMLTRQLSQLVQALPGYINQGQAMVAKLQEQYP